MQYSISKFLNNWNLNNYLKRFKKLKLFCTVNIVQKYDFDGNILQNKIKENDEIKREI